MQAFGLKTESYRMGIFLATGGAFLKNFIHFQIFSQLLSYLRYWSRGRYTSWSLAIGIRRLYISNQNLTSGQESKSGQY